MILGMKDFLRGPDHVFMQCVNGMHPAERPEPEDMSTLRKRISLADPSPRRSSPGAGDPSTESSTYDDATFSTIFLKP